MKIAVIGAGIAGLSSAYYLSRQHDVTVFEANNYLGGHTDTHSIAVQGKIWQVDSGFIVFNERNYPYFSELLAELDIASQGTEMSFSVHNTQTGLEYNATDLNRLFCQRRNLINPRFHRMLWDLVKFYRQAPRFLSKADDEMTLGRYLQDNGYSESFIHDHLIPMACALWSGPTASIQHFPLRYFVAFMYNHRMLSLVNRPQWRVVQGGSHSYVDAIKQSCDAQFLTSSPVQLIQRGHEHVTLTVNGEQHQFDKVVIATHSDQALRLLDKPTPAEISVLGSIAYQPNEMLLHSDTSVLPARREAWASWNVRVGPDLEHKCTVSYHMNTLQNLDAPVDFIVSLNSNQFIDKDKVFVSRQYSHPVYNVNTIRAQRRWHEISGHNHTYYCGAYWGWGFHEDGVKSARRVTDAIAEARDAA